ncbi:MAG: hypothetical protein HRU18_01445 [Pseudoalteromonas sp.]|uniref:hypothetical protein n=1 Tax=Pseudoalteromonas sp. TaxID=53249 RepID=UPI001D991E9F|nr:hypothetical protein [Pseudoalteromonas sp.]NRA76845.1 hypothetical protein [Pseudoalteromonas sp.]
MEDVDVSELLNIYGYDDERHFLTDLLREKEVIKLEEDFIEFIKGAWHLIEPNTVFSSNWTTEAVGMHLEATLDGTIRNLLINIPPRFSKSLIVNVFFPAWVWTKDPSKQFIFSSYAENLAIRDSIKCRTIVQSDWYRSRWPNVTIRSDQNTKKEWVLDQGGHRIITTVGGSGTGKGGHYVITDDPNDAKHARSPAKLEDVQYWWDNTMSTRLSNPKTGIKIVIQQRIAEGDLTGHIVKQGGYCHLIIPMRYDSEQSHTTDIGWEDPRTEEGELAWPERFGEAEVAELKLRLGSDGYAGQLQQRPAPKGGKIVKKTWFKRYQALPQMDKTVLSIDCSFKDEETSDYVVMGLWGIKGPNKYLIHLVRDKLDIVDTIVELADIQSRFSGISYTLIEDKANGPAVIRMIQDKVKGVIAFNPGQDSKTARLNAVAPQIEAGNLYLPDKYYEPNRERLPWIHSEADRSLLDIYIDELTLFPKASNDDCVDMTTQLFLKEMEGGNWFDDMLKEANENKAPEEKLTSKLAEMMGWNIT